MKTVTWSDTATQSLHSSRRPRLWTTGPQIWARWPRVWTRRPTSRPTAAARSPSSSASRERWNHRFPKWLKGTGVRTRTPRCCRSLPTRPAPTAVRTPPPPPGGPSPGQSCRRRWCCLSFDYGRWLWLQVLFVVVVLLGVLLYHPFAVVLVFVDMMVKVVISVVGCCSYSLSSCRYGGGGCYRYCWCWLSFGYGCWLWFLILFVVVLLEVNGRRTPNYLLTLEVLYHFLAVPMGERTTHIVTVVVAISCSSLSAFQYDVVDVVDVVFVWLRLLSVVRCWCCLWSHVLNFFIFSN